MGLDMYLDRKISAYRVNRETGRFERSKVLMGNEIYDDVKEIVVKFGYWRKANAIHRWFVENVQGGEDNCSSYPVSASQLTELRSLCEIVLKNHSLAKKLLPTQEGFFFGGTDYDDWYYDSLKYTAELLKDIENSGDEYEYYSSW